MTSDRFFNLRDEPRPGDAFEIHAALRGARRHLPDIQPCADKASISRERLPVRVSVDKAGHVSASVLDAAELRSAAASILR